MKIQLLVLSLLMSYFSFSQEKVVSIDSTKVTIIGDVLYKAHQEYISNNNGDLSTKIRYTKIDLSNIVFETSKSKILPTSYNSLNALLTLLIDNSKVILKIVGHTDKIGHSPSNLKLSIRRARAIRLYLVKKGVKLDRILAIGYGDQLPICTTPCKENQRVEFTLIHDGSEQKLVTRQLID